MSNNGIPPLNDWQADNYPVIYDEGDETLKYVKTGTKHDIDTGSSGYLSYVAMITQSGTDAPVGAILTNTTDATVWQTNADGDYRLEGTFPQNKTWIQGFGDFTDLAVPCMPITNSGAIVGYYLMYAADTAVKLWVLDVAFTQCTLSSLIGTSRLYLPEIRVYP